MGLMNCGKASTIFQEKAAELENIVLTNKTFQTTRFVRSLMRGNTAALRNLPTIVAVVADDHQEATLAIPHDAKRSAQLKKLLDSLTNAKTLFFAIGIGQLLEPYCVASLEAQYASHFPIQVWERIDSAKSELEKLSNSWSWNESNLKLAAIGSPKEHIEHILDKHEYKPFISPGSLRHNKIKDFAELLVDSDNFSLFDEENYRVREQGNAKKNNSLPITDANIETLQIVERNLQEVAAELKNRWDIRQTKTKLQKATIEVFGQIHETECEFDTDQMISLLEKVIKCLPPHLSELFDPESCSQGFCAWNNFWRDSFDRENVNDDFSALAHVHIYYENWVKKMESEDYLDFQKLWEAVMIRSTSEAMCETVGSMMNQHGGKNRHLEPNYFSMEMVMRVNLGPLHHLDGFIQKVYDFEKKDYIRGEKRVNQTSSKDLSKSAALDSFQKRNEQKSRYPSLFWHDYFK